MKITRIELYHVSVPLEETFWPTWIPGYPQTHNRFTLIKLVTDEGIEGYGAGIPAAASLGRPSTTGDSGAIHQISKHHQACPHHTF